MILNGGPDPMFGWSESAYLSSWQQIAIARMQSMGVTIVDRTISRSRAVNPYENSSVFMVERVPQRTNFELGLRPEPDLR